MPRKKKTVEESAFESGTTTPAAPVAGSTSARKRSAAASPRKKAAAAPARPRTRRTKTAAAASPAPANGNSTFPDEVSFKEQIALLAYSYWEARGRQGGSPHEDWIRAEREILARQAARSEM